MIVYLEVMTKLCFSLFPWIQVDTDLTSNQVLLSSKLSISCMISCISLICDNICSFFIEWYMLMITTQFYVQY